MPLATVDGLSINYDVQGDGRARCCSSPTSRPITRATRSSCRPTPSTSRCIAIDLPGDRRERQAARAVLDRGLRGAASPASSAPSGSSRRTSRASRSAPAWRCTWPPAIPSACARSRCTALGPQRRLSEDLRRDVAHAREVAADRRGHGHPGHLPVLLHARDVRRAAEDVDALVDFVRSRHAQPLEAFLAQSEAALAHDVSAVLGEIEAPALITFGARDLVCSSASPSPRRAGSPAASWSSSITCCTPGCTRTPRPSIGRRSTSCAASPRGTDPAASAGPARIARVLDHVGFEVADLAALRRVLRRALPPRSAGGASVDSRDAHRLRHQRRAAVDRRPRAVAQRRASATSPSRASGAPRGRRRLRRRAGGRRHRRRRAAAARARQYGPRVV